MFAKWYCISCSGKGMVRMEVFRNVELGISFIIQDHHEFYPQCSASKDQLLIFKGKGLWARLSSIEKKGKEIEMERRGES